MRQAERVRPELRVDRILGFERNVVFDVVEHPTQRDVGQVVVGKPAADIRMRPREERLCQSLGTFAGTPVCGRKVEAFLICGDRMKG